MSTEGKLRIFMELSKLARRYTINSNEIVFSVIRNEILKMLGKQHGPTKIIVKNEKQYININVPYSIIVYYLLKLLDTGWTIIDNSEKRILMNIYY